MLPGAPLTIAALLASAAQAPAGGGLLEGLQGVGYLLLLIGMGVSVWLTLRHLRRQVAALEAERATILAREAELRTLLQAVDEVTRAKAVRHIERLRPAEHPAPGVQPTIDLMGYQEPELSRDPLFFAAGWVVLKGVPGVVCFSLNSRSEYFTGHMALSGETRHGKGTLAFLIAATLCLRATNRQLRIFAIDPKRDFSLWAGKAHNWREPVTDTRAEALTTAMGALRAERERREALRARFRKLENADLPLEVRPPVLLVYVAELSLIAAAVGERELDLWLAQEMSTALASDIIYLVDTQNNANRNTGWRTHFSTFLAGFQSSESAVAPNIGMTAREIEKLGGTPPNELPGKRYFVVRNGRDVATMRVPLITIDDREQVLARLPDTAEPLSVGAVDAPALAAAATAAPGAAPRRPGEVEVSPEEEAAILQHAQAVIAEQGDAAERAEVCRRSFNGQSTGLAYKKVKKVLDAHGLIVPRQPRPQLADVA